jgi:hypothetical protein
MVRVIGFLTMAFLLVSAVVLVDYNSNRQQRLAETQIDLPLAEYLGGLPARLSAATASSSAPSLPSRLADMLPPAPEGWTVRKAQNGDGAGFLPRGGAPLDPLVQHLLREAVTARVRGAEEVVSLTFEAGERQVMLMAIRYPDTVFTDPARHDQRFDLQTLNLGFPEVPLLTARGLDFVEDMLPNGTRARLIRADLGGQLHLRLFVPQRFDEADLVPFLQGLNVAAMNAAVVDRQPGLGEVPVIVLPAAMREAEAEAYRAARSERAAAELARARALRDAARDEVAALAAAAGTDAAPATGEAAECTIEGGLKRCRVAN